MNRQAKRAGAPVYLRDGWMQTFTGAEFWPFYPRVEDVRIEDIAHALSQMCRYGGHCRRFYSVAEHSVLLSEMCQPKDALHALLHDAAEAYCGDVIWPIKRGMHQAVSLEHWIRQAIFERWGLGPLPAEVEALDRRMLTDEAAQNMAPPPERWATHARPLGVTLRFWAPEEAERQFLRAFERAMRQPRTIWRAAL